MNRIIFLVFTILFSCKLSFSQSNILLIISDDLGVDASQGYHNSPILPNTPNLDSLRANGITFKNAWASAVCSPTRAGIMSGKYGIKTGVRKAPGNLDTTHTSIFKAIATQTNNAYADAVIGKWHISSPADKNHPQQHGVDHYAGAFDFGVSDYYNWTKTTNGTDANETEYITSHITTDAVNWIGSQTQPWFLWLAHVAPHSPYHVPPANLYTSTNVGNNKGKYMAAIEAMDAEIGRLLNSMSTAERQNTLIIYIGDNGTPNGAPLQNYAPGHSKSSVYEGGVRVPLIVSGAGVSRQNEEEHALVHSVDIYATILDYVGAQLNGGIYNSLSFKHLFTAIGGNTRPYNYTEYRDGTDEEWAIRNMQYKLLNHNNSTQEFYDLSIDSLETNNIIGSLSSAQQLIKTEFEAEALQRQTAWSCNDFIQNGDETGIDCGGTYCAACPPTATSNINKEDIQVYPNPAGNLLNVFVNNLSAEIKIYSVEGKLIKRVSTAASTTSIDLSNLSNGIYLLDIVKENGELIHRQKVVVDHDL